MNDVSGYNSLFITSRDGLKLHARDYGAQHRDRLPVVCLPGLARTSADFQELAEALSRDAKAPRRVFCIDYRGRGRSDYDPDWRRYDIRVELDDVMQMLTAAGIEQAVFVGTSRGGLLTMALSAARPAAIRGVVMNDIGPVIDAAGLIRIRSYIGKMAQPRDYQQAVETLRRIFGGQFPVFTDTEWRIMAERTWKTTGQGLVTDYDPNLMKTLDQLDLEAPLPILWNYFEGLYGVPLLALRGEHSDLLSAETLQEMARRHPNAEVVTVPGQGHAPILGAKDIVMRIQKLASRAEA